HAFGHRARHRQRSLTVDHVPRGAGETAADFLLVRWVDVVAVADIDRDRQTAMGVFADGKPLRLAHFRPLAFSRACRRAAVVRELHDEQWELCAEARTQIVTQAAQQYAVIARIAGVRFTLGPD